MSVKLVIEAKKKYDIIKGKNWGCDTATGSFKNITITEFDNDWHSTIKHFTSISHRTIVKDYISIYYGNYFYHLMRKEDEVGFEFQYNISKYINNEKFITRLHTPPG